MFLTRNINGYINYKLIYCMRDNSMYYINKWEPQILKVIIFPIILYLTIYIARFSLPILTALVV